MKTTTNFNIQGTIFYMDDEALALFKPYLDSIHAHFKESRGRDEIINDIEMRMVELFQQQLSSPNQVVGVKEVRFVMDVMGSPSDFDEENQSAYLYRPARQKRLFRDIDHRMLGGVSSGLGAYFNLDPTWPRLAFVVATFSGLSPFVYVIMWIVVPPARTIAEKLEMYGEPINISNIEKAILEEMGELKNKFGEYTGRARSKFRRR